MTGVEPTFQMWATYGLIVVALALYATEVLPMQVVSVGVVCALLIFFDLFPVTDGSGTNLLDAARILQGFANPALVTVLALLVMGQGMVHAGVLDVLARMVLRLAGGRQAAAVALVLLVAMSVSAFLNNIPVVVIFVPIMQALSARFGNPTSKVMIPLSYAAVLGGMTTLVGSSTNLLVNSALIEVDHQPFEFFEFTVPGIVMALCGFAYVLWVAPRFLPLRESMANQLLEGGGKQFIAQITVGANSPLIGAGAHGGLFAALPNMTVRMVQRGEEAILPPFEAYEAKVGDILVVAATRKALTDAEARKPGLLHPVAMSDERREGQRDRARPKGDDDGKWGEGSRIMAEVMVAPASRFDGQTLRQIAFYHRTGCVVLGIQRRARMIRASMTDIRLEAGDVLLIQGTPADVGALKANRDVILIEWSAEEIPGLVHAKSALTIFIISMGSAAAGLIPIVVATLTGAVAMVAFGVLNTRQAARAVDPRIVATIGAALALGVAMQATGGAQYVANALVDVLEGASAPVVLSVFFLTVAGLSNVISTKTTAVLFTPIAVDIAGVLDAPVHAFALAVVFAANCSFASPLGYQTNLLVLGPGHYRFIDFTRAGVPLVVLLWLVFSLFVPWWYGM